MILASLEKIFADVKMASGMIIRYSREDRKSHQNSHTFYLAYERTGPKNLDKPISGESATF
jgi:hypothetical protein